jgi:hypothetical protein
LFSGDALSEEFEIMHVSGFVSKAQICMRVPEALAGWYPPDEGKLSPELNLLRSTNQNISGTLGRHYPCESACRDFLLNSAPERRTLSGLYILVIIAVAGFMAGDFAACQRRNPRSSCAGK